MATAGEVWCSAGETSGAGSAPLDLKSDDVLSWVAEFSGIDDNAALSIEVMIRGAAFALDATIWALGSDDVAPCCGAAISEVGELVSSVVAPAGVSASGAAAVVSTLASGDRSA